MEKPCKRQCLGLIADEPEKEETTTRKNVLDGVRYHGRPLRLVPEMYRNDKEIVLAAIATQSGRVLEFASERLCNDPQVVEAAINKDIFAFQYASLEIRSGRHLHSRQVVLALARRHGVAALKWTHSHFQNDMEIVETAIEQCAFALLHAAPAFRTHRYFVWKAVQQNAMILQYLDQTTAIHGDYYIMTEAVRQDGLLLRLTTKKLQNDPTLVLMAIRQTGSALQFASDRLKNDPEMVAQATKGNVLNLQFASAQIQSNRQVVLAAIQRNPLVLQFTPAFHTDREMLWQAVGINGLALRFASSLTGLHLDKALVLRAVTQTGSAIQYAAEEFKGDRDILTIAIQQDGFNLRYANEDLQNDLEMITLAIRNVKDQTKSRLNPRSRVLIFWQKAVGEPFRKRAKAVTRALWMQTNLWCPSEADKKKMMDQFRDDTSATDTTVAGDAVRHYAEHVIKRALRERMWLLRQITLSAGIDMEQERHILQFSHDMTKQYQLVDDLIQLAPFFAVLAEIPCRQPSFWAELL